LNCYQIRGSRRIDTQFTLVTQWDGYVINAEAWTEEFLDYDYIGARWIGDVVKAAGSPPEYNVGNGGFSLRSDIFLGAGTDRHLTTPPPRKTRIFAARIGHFWSRRTGSAM